MRIREGMMRREALVRRVVGGGFLWRDGVVGCFVGVCIGGMGSK